MSDFKGTYKVYKIGRMNVIEQSEAYFQMVKELYLHHDDLLNLLAVMGANPNDGTAIYILITHLDLEFKVYNGIPCEEVYDKIYQALKKRPDSKRMDRSQVMDAYHETKPYAKGAVEFTNEIFEQNSGQDKKKANS
jgi:hypothetical protein